jgi:hypothetical protein
MAQAKAVEMCDLRVHRRIDKMLKTKILPDQYATNEIKFKVQCFILSLYTDIFIASSTFENSLKQALNDLKE